MKSVSMLLMGSLLYLWKRHSALSTSYEQKITSVYFTSAFTVENEKRKRTITLLVFFKVSQGLIALAKCQQHLPQVKQKK